MRSDWHRYNLKRRVASLPPISSETFTEKVISAQANSSAAAAKASFEQACTACQKTYFSGNAYRDHLSSKKHRSRVLATAMGGTANTESVARGAASLDEPARASSLPGKTNLEPQAEFDKVVDGLEDTTTSEPNSLPLRPSRTHRLASERKDDQTPPVEAPEHMTIDESVQVPQSNVSLSKCLFCNYDSPTWKLSISHMTKIHGLFIPEQAFLTDLEGLIRYLQAKVQQNHECLLCHKLKGTTSGVQTHMRDKGHCMIAFETEEEMVEIGQFYDFSSTYTDEESDDADMGRPSDPVTNGGVRLPGSKMDDAEDDGWETDSSFSSLDSADLTSAPLEDHSHQYSKLALHRHHSHHDPRPHRSADGFHSHAHHHGINAVFHDDVELHLPSGRTAGHRDFKKYYRQNLRSYPAGAERTEKAQNLLKHSEDMEDNVEDASASSSRSNPSQSLAKRSEAGMLGATVSQRKEVQASEIRGRRQGEKALNRYRAKLEKQNNFQKHFRDPLLQ